MMNRAEVKSWFKNYGSWVIAVFHFVGILLLGGPWSSDFVMLTPLNLLLLSVVYLITSDKVKRPLLYALPALMGFLVEMLGTNTGFPFGEYSYSSILGPGLLGTPFLIGVLWWVLLRSFNDVFSRISSNKTIISLATGLGMLLLDIFIEPVAIGLGFWEWQAAEVPLENYMAWFVLSFVFTRLTMDGQVNNTMSKWVLIVLGGFFVVMGILIP
ncbi:MAG: carotenoid biosynthesis protein [Schleiferiaceae bacterium]|jgi:putative membrane protein|tara:strand:+ start:3310 stop:3948 length:639 start_codon:yes stop_codon:yes gene_type:complete